MTAPCIFTSMLASYYLPLLGVAIGEKELGQVGQIITASKVET